MSSHYPEFADHDLPVQVRRFKDTDKYYVYNTETKEVVAGEEKTLTKFTAMEIWFDEIKANHPELIL